MPTITAIEKVKRKPRCDVYLDGVLALDLRLDLTAIARLKVGLELSAERLRELQAEDQRLSAIEYALRLLAMGPRSEKDLRDRLKRRGLRREAVEAGVTRVRELGYVDDAAYARFFVDSRQASSPRSRRALSFDLQRKGVSRELVAETVALLSDTDGAYDAARRRLVAFRKLDRPTFTRRLGNFLASRGFGYGVVRQTLDRCWAELHDDDGDTEMGETELSWQD
jgi:regulatory protein